MEETLNFSGRTTENSTDIPHNIATPKPRKSKVFQRHNGSQWSCIPRDTREANDHNKPQGIHQQNAQGSDLGWDKGMTKEKTLDTPEGFSSFLDKLKGHLS